NQGNGRLMIGVRRPEITHTCPATRKPVRTRVNVAYFELRTRKQPVRKRNGAVSRQRCCLDADEAPRVISQRWVGRGVPTAPFRAFRGVAARWDTAPYLPAKHFS